MCRVCSRVVIAIRFEDFITRVLLLDVSPTGDKSEEFGVVWYWCIFSEVFLFLTTLLLAAVDVADVFTGHWFVRRTFLNIISWMRCSFFAYYWLSPFWNEIVRMSSLFHALLLFFCLWLYQCFTYLFLFYFIFIFKLLQSCYAAPEALLRAIFSSVLFLNIDG